MLEKENFTNLSDEENIINFAVEKIIEDSSFYNALGSKLYPRDKIYKELGERLKARRDKLGYNTYKTTKFAKNISRDTAMRCENGGFNITHTMFYYIDSLMNLKQKSK